MPNDAEIRKALRPAEPSEPGDLARAVLRAPKPTTVARVAPRTSTLKARKDAAARHWMKDAAVRRDRENLLRQLAELVSDRLPSNIVNVFAADFVPDDDTDDDGEYAEVTVRRERNEHVR